MTVTSVFLGRLKDSINLEFVSSLPVQHTYGSIPFINLSRILTRKLSVLLKFYVKNFLLYLKINLFLVQPIVTVP